MDEEDQQQGGGLNITCEEGLAHRKPKDSKALAVNTEGVAKVGETPSLTGEFIGNWGYSRVSKQHCSLSDPSPTDSATMQQRGMPCPGKYLRL